MARRNKKLSQRRDISGASAEESLIRAKQRLEFAQVSANAGIWDWDMTTGKLEWSTALFRLFGLDPKTVSASFDSWSRVMLPQDRKIAGERIQTAIKRRSPLSNEYRIMLPSGEIRWINALGDTVYDVRGKPLRMSGICLDITRRKLAEEKIKHLASFPERNPNPVIEVCDSGKVSFSNRATAKVLKLLGAPKGISLFFPSDFSKILKSLRLKKKYTVNREVNVAGSVFFESISVLPESKVVRIYASDITERRNKEEELNKLNKTLKALSDNNQALMRVADESVYLKEVCGIIEKDCDYNMVWIGFADFDESKKVRIVAQAGFDKSYLESVNITWADTERGRGPTGTCIRTGKIAVCRNMLTDPNFLPWRAAALKRGYASSISIPLASDGKTFGAITLYSKNADPFSESEVKLLAELAEDISYGIIALRTRAAHAKAEEETLRAHGKISSILQSITEAYIVFDRGGRFVELNRCAEDFLGKKTDELKGRAFREIFPKVQEKEFYHLFRKAMAQNKPAHFEAFSNLTGRWFETHAYPFDSGLAVYLHDITHRKRSDELLHETRDYLESLINYANAPIIVWDPDFKIVRFNRAFEFLSGYEADEVIGKDLEILFPQEYKDESIANIERTLTGEHWESVEIPIRCKSADVRTLLWNSANIYKQGTRNLLATIAQGQDITGRKHAEDMLTKARDDLEHRVAQRTSDLIKAQKELMSAKRLSDIGALSATVAHELRNPLGVIRAAAFNVRRKNLNPNLEKHLDRIDKKILESDQIINNLLFYSRIQLPRVEKVRLADIISETIADARIKYKGTEVIVRNKSGALKAIMIEADPAQMTELFSNILNNAYESFSAKKGLIEIKGSFDDDNGLAKIIYQDNGCGIPEEIIHKIREPFFTTKSQGTGLGLAVCNQVARLHGGTIEVTSTEGKGSVFTIILPAKREQKKAAE